MDINIFNNLGFSDRMTAIYLTLLKTGPSSVRKLAEFAGFNRGVVYEDLKKLQDQGLVEFFEKENRQYFVAEDPERLMNVVGVQEKELKQTADKLAESIPELKSLYNAGGGAPVARYFEKKEIAKILGDILERCVARGENSYRIYSAAGIREYLYDSFASFSDARIGKGIRVKVIALGEGGELRGLDERKWLDVEGGTPTYIIIYPGKTAYISLNAKKEAVGVVIENDGVFETQKIIFDNLWESL